VIKNENEKGELAHSVKVSLFSFLRGQEMEETKLQGGPLLYP
jgi:hypothetical protein